jgi:hypothetical protein
MSEQQNDNIMYFTNNSCWFCGISLEDGTGTLTIFGALCDRCKSFLAKEQEKSYGL